MGVEKIVPVGSWLGPIVVPLTRALRAVNARVGNYGVAIILLTIGIGIALSPLRHYAILSSAKMAKVGPQIRAVQERYKRLSLTDPKRQQMQQEIAEVYEKNGIDMVRQTAAGCLPTLLTMPFLFAFYRMLDISVDLKGAPFFWIPDLSLKDPLFITPLLSGLSMIAMQRLMPAPAVDPAQQRMMMLMPVIFSGMFAWAPAGLNLYWFVSNLVAMAQQALAMYFAPHLFPEGQAQSLTRSGQPRACSKDCPRSRTATPERDWADTWPASVTGRQKVNLTGARNEEEAFHTLIRPILGSRGASLGSRHRRGLRKWFSRIDPGRPSAGSRVHASGASRQTMGVPPRCRARNEDPERDGPARAKRRVSGPESGDRDHARGGSRPRGAPAPSGARGLRARLWRPRAARRREASAARGFDRPAPMFHVKRDPARMLF